MFISACYGASQVEINFAKEYFIPPGTDVEKYIKFDLRHYRTGYNTDLITDVSNLDIDFASEEIQL